MEMPLYEIKPELAEEINDKMSEEVKRAFEDRDEYLISEIGDFSDRFRDMYNKLNIVDNSDLNFGRVCEAAGRAGSKLAGCDIEKDVGKDDGIEYLKNIVEKKWEEREETMADRIIKYSESSEGPVVAIVGRNHVQSNSHLIEKLEESEISYKSKVLETQMSQEEEKAAEKALEEKINSASC